MVAGAVAFAYAYFDKQYVPIQIVASLFFVEFAIRVTVELRYSPFGVVAHAMTRGRTPRVGLGETKALRAVARAGDIARDDRHHQQRHPRLPAANHLPHLSDAHVDGVRARAVHRLRDPRPARAAWLDRQAPGCRVLC
jgi:hypothetical protein